MGLDVSQNQAEEIIMTEAIAGLDRVVDSMRNPLREYVQLLCELAEENGKALTLFGAIAGETFDASRHTVRSALVLGRMDLTMLGRLAPHGPGLGKVGIAAPLTMTPQYIHASLDTFPLEFMEIQQKHITVFGEDYFSGLSFAPPDVRLQCERELKAILIGLRQGLLAAAGSDKFLGALQRDIGDGLVRTLRGLLWLKEQREAKPLPLVLEEIEKIADREMPGVRQTLRPDGAHGWNEFELFYGDVEALGRIVNDW